MFRFYSPNILYLLAAVVVMYVLLQFLYHVRKRSMRKFASLELLPTLTPSVSSFRIRLKNGLFLTALSLVIVAAARPQFGSTIKENKMEGVEMMLVVDVSNSMLAEDLTPNRLERTRYAIDKLFSTLSQDRVGMIVFAGEAKVQLPITTDYRMARSFAKRLSTQLLEKQGTDLGQAIDLATLSFSSKKDVSKVMILITDGETHDSRAGEEAKKAKDQGINIFAIGIGTPEGAPVKINGEMLKDENGDMVVTKLDEKTLISITEIANGGYIRATAANFGLDDIVRKINDMQKSELDTLQFEQYNEQYWWFLLVAAVLLFAEAILLPMRNPKLRRFNIFKMQ
ncbi:MAG: VWA domain-containing protein [Alistipes sp.]|nr:VWA domain-containing protein [Candidatus Alistipes equi]